MVKRLPLQLVGDKMKLLRLFIRVDVRSITSVSVIRALMSVIRVVCAGGEDPVDPGLLVLMPRSHERGAGELFIVQAVRSSLGRVLGDWQGSINCFGSELEEVAVNFARTH